MNSHLLTARCAGCCLALAFASEVAAEVVRPIPVPGRIEAENYDTNGPGVSYYDKGVGNAGNVYRADDVDIEATTDIDGGYNVGWIDSGEWLNYSLNVQETAVYEFSFRVASASTAGSIQVSIDGLPLGTVATPYTSGWQNWRTVTPQQPGAACRSTVVACAIPDQRAKFQLSASDKTAELSRRISSRVGQTNRRWPGPQCSFARDGHWQLDAAGTLHDGCVGHRGQSTAVENENRATGRHEQHDCIL